MTTLIMLFLKSMLSKVMSLVSVIIEFVTKNPALAAGIAVLVASNLATYHYVKVATETRVKDEVQIVIDDLNGKIEKANLETTARNERAKEIEGKSKADAEEAAAQIAAKNKELDRVSALYKSNLATNKLIKTYVVNLPQQDAEPQATVNVQMEGGQVVCNRFPSTFLTTINSLVDEVNKPVIIPATTGVTK